MEALDEVDLSLAGIVPEDSTVYDFDVNGRPTIHMPDDNPAFAASCKLFEKIIIE